MRNTNEQARLLFRIHNLCLYFVAAVLRHLSPKLPSNTGMPAIEVLQRNLSTRSVIVSFSFRAIHFLDTARGCPVTRKGLFQTPFRLRHGHVHPRLWPVMDAKKGRSEDRPFQLNRMVRL